MTATRRRLLGWLGLAPIAAAGGAAHAGLPPPPPPPPPRAPVRVLFARVNGEAYYQAAAALPSLEVGHPVTLRREPHNAYDRRAIEVLDAAGRKLGYLARGDNSAVARMMDAGERFAPRVARLDRQAADIRVEVDWLPGAGDRTRQEATHPAA